MKPHWIRLLLASVLVGLLLLSCSDDDKEQPEIIGSSGGGGSGGATGASAPEIISSGPGSSAGIAPLISSRFDTGGLTVMGSASATVPADRATVVIMLSGAPVGPGPMVTLAQRDRDAIIAAVQPLGIAAADVRFDSDTTYGPFPTVNINVPVGDVQSRGQSIVGAISAIRGAQSSGVRFGVSDCSAAMAPLRKQAFDAAAADAQSFATATGLTVGPATSIYQLPVTSGYGPPTSPCDPDAQLLKSPAGIQSLDANPTVNLDLNLSVTFALGGDAGSATRAPQLTATGSGEVRAKADEAYVLIATTLQGGGPFGPPLLQSRDRQEIIAEIRKLGVDEDDIQVESPGFGAPLLVSVEVEIGKLPQIGRDIAAAVQNVLGSAEQQGVRFTHSNCQAVLDEARKHAMADAKRQAESLAASAGVTLGSVVAVSDGTSPHFGPYPQGLITCSDDITRLVQLGPYSTQLATFDAPAEFTINAVTELSYSIETP